MKRRQFLVIHENDLGSLNVAALDRVRADLHQAIQRSRNGTLEVSLPKAETAGAALAAIFYEAEKDVRALGGELIVRDAKPSVCKILVLCGLGHLLASNMK